ERSAAGSHAVTAPAAAAATIGRPTRGDGGRAAIDVSGLAPGGFGHRSLMWWGTLGIVLIEGTAFALTIAAYFYLRTRNPQWPPDGIAPPSLFWGTANVIVLVLSGIPNQFAKRAAERVAIWPVRLWLVVCILFGIAVNGIRV